MLTPTQTNLMRAPLVTLLAAASLACAGMGNHATPGSGSGDQPTPGVLVAPPLHSLSVGSGHACGLAEDGRAFCWGSNSFGQLGDDSFGGSTPTPVPVAGGLRFERVSAGAAHSCGIETTGAIYCWGLDSDGQLGAPPRELCDGLACSPRPVAVGGGQRFEQVSAGYAHSCALSDGRAYCWGLNTRGQLGVSTTPAACGGVACSMTPVPVESGLRFSTISVHGQHSCALASGVAYCWGDNRDGQLGGGSDADLAVHPTPVAGRARFVDIATGGLHSCGIDTRGRALCWGSNGAGALGTREAGNRVLPAPVESGARFAAITTSGTRTCALTRDGAVHCWGDSSRGVQSLPSPTTGVLAATSLSAGDGQTCAVTGDGTRCWGSRNTALAARR